MTHKQQTAVQWLMERIRERQILSVWHNSKPNFKPLFDKALVMEREQIEMAYKADLYPCSDEDAKQYFTDTYQTEQ